jgi:hypothetical protein
MRRRIMFTLIGLAVVSSLGRREGSLLVHLLAIPTALLLYPLAMLAVFAILISPFVYALGGWLLWARLRDGEFPDCAKRAMQWASARRPWGYRLRLEKVKPADPPIPAS